MIEYIRLEGIIVIVKRTVYCPSPVLRLMTLIRVVTHIDRRMTPVFSARSLKVKIKNIFETFPHAVSVSHGPLEPYTCFFFSSSSPPLMGTADTETVVVIGTLPELAAEVDVEVGPDALSLPTPYNVSAR